MIISHHPDQIKIWFSFLFFRSKEVEAFPAPWLARPPVQFQAFRWKTWIKPASIWQHGQSHQYQQVRWNPGDLSPMSWEVRTVYHEASSEVQGVMCYVLLLGVCLVFCSLLCLISPAEQLQPPPTPGTRRWSHHETWDMSPTHETRGEGQHSRFLQSPEY